MDARTIIIQKQSAVGINLPSCFHSRQPKTTAKQEAIIMGKLKSADSQLLHSGRPSRQERTYTRIIKKTNQVQTVTIKNPRTAISANQKHSAKAFSLVISTLSRWIRENKAANSADYQEVKEKGIKINMNKHIVRKYGYKNFNVNITVRVDNSKSCRVNFGYEAMPLT